jgi:hypothetical protein
MIPEWPSPNGPNRDRQDTAKAGLLKVAGVAMELRNVEEV